MDTRKEIAVEFGRALLNIPQLLRRLAFRTRSLEQELQEAMLRGNLRKSFNGLGLLMLGLGVVVGTGAFTLTGQAMAEYAGSAVFLSYLIMGVASGCAAACYAELCVEYPVSGSAFTYVLSTFGELPAFVTLGMLLLEYVLGAAAVARSFSRYIALLAGLPPTALLVAYGDGAYIDGTAAAVVLVLTAALSFGVRESSAVLTGATLLKLLMLAVVVVVGFTQAQAATFVDSFSLPGASADAVFQGAAFVFFAYTAFDAVCNAAEEAERIEDLPPAIMGTVGIASGVYVLMALSLSFMVTPDQLLACGTTEATDAPLAPAGQTYTPIQGDGCPAALDRNYQLAFNYAFTANGLPGMSYFVAVTALLGILTSLLVSLYSVARLVMVASRDWLLPPQLARVSARTQTPLAAQAAVGGAVAAVALLVAFVELSQLVSFGTLFAMWMVCNTLLFRRFYPDVKLRFTRYGTVEATQSASLRRVPGAALGERARRALVVGHLAAINALSIAFAAVYQATLIAPEAGEDIPRARQHEFAAVMVCAGLGAGWLAATASMLLWCPLAYEPRGWRIPRLLLPWMPSFAILLICFSVGSLENSVYIYMAIYLVGLLAFYVLYALPMSYIKHYKLDADNTEQLNVVELVFSQGKWQTVTEVLSLAPRPSELSSVQMSGLSSVRRYALASTQPSGAAPPGGSGVGSDGGKSGGAAHLPALPEEGDAIR